MKTRWTGARYRLNPYFFLSERRVWLFVALMIALVGAVVVWHNVALSMTYWVATTGVNFRTSSPYTLAMWALFGICVVTWGLAPWLHLMAVVKDPRTISRLRRGVWEHVVFKPKGSAGSMAPADDRSVLERQLQRALDLAVPALSSRLERQTGRPVLAAHLPHIVVITTDHVCSPYSYHALGAYRIVVPIRVVAQQAEMESERQRIDRWTALLAHELSHTLNESGDGFWSDARLVGMASAARAILRSILIHLGLVALLWWFIDPFMGDTTHRAALLGPAALLLTFSVAGGSIGPSLIRQIPAQGGRWRFIRWGAIGFSVVTPLVTAAMVAAARIPVSPGWVAGSWTGTIGLAACTWFLAWIAEGIGRRQMEYIADEAARMTMVDILTARRDRDLGQVLEDAIIETSPHHAHLRLHEPIVAELAASLHTPEADRAHLTVKQALHEDGVSSESLRVLVERLMGAAEAFATKHPHSFGPGAMEVLSTDLCVSALSTLENRLVGDADQHLAPAFSLGAAAPPLAHIARDPARPGPDLATLLQQMDWLRKTHPPLAERISAYRQPDQRASGRSELSMVSVLITVTLIPKLLQMASPEPERTATLRASNAQSPSELIGLLALFLLFLVARRPSGGGSAHNRYFQQFFKETMHVLVSFGSGAAIAIFLLTLLQQKGISAPVQLFLLGDRPVPPLGAMIALTGMFSGLFLVLRFFFLSGWAFLPGASLRAQVACHLLNFAKAFGLGCVPWILLYSAVQQLAGPTGQDEASTWMRWLGGSSGGQDLIVSYGLQSLVFGLVYANVVRFWPSMPREVRCPVGHAVPMRWHDVLAGRDERGDWGWLRCPTCDRSPQERGPLISDANARPETQPSLRIWGAVLATYGLSLMALFAWMAHGQFLDLRGATLLSLDEATILNSATRPMPRAPRSQEDSDTYPAILGAEQRAAKLPQLIDLAEDLAPYFDEVGETTPAAPVWWGLLELAPRREGSVGAARGLHHGSAD